MDRPRVMRSWPEVGNSQSGLRDFGAGISSI